MMVDAEIVAAKLSDLEHRLERVVQFCPEHVEELEQDRFELLSFNLMLGIQACLDIASHLIADEGWRPATTLAESFARLEEKGVLESKTARDLQKAAGLRNIVAHIYSQVDPEKIHRAALRAPETLGAFSSQIALWLNEQSMATPSPTSPPG